MLNHRPFSTFSTFFSTFLGQEENLSGSATAVVAQHPQLNEQQSMEENGGHGESNHKQQQIYHRIINGEEVVDREEEKEM